MLCGVSFFFYYNKFLLILLLLLSLQFPISAFQATAVSSFFFFGMTEAGFPRAKAFCVSSLQVDDWYTGFIFNMQTLNFHFLIMIVFQSLPHAVFSWLIFQISFLKMSTHFSLMKKTAAWDVVFGFVLFLLLTGELKRACPWSEVLASACVFLWLMCICGIFQDSWEMSSGWVSSMKV